MALDGGGTRCTMDVHCTLVSFLGNKPNINHKSIPFAELSKI